MIFKGKYVWFLLRGYGICKNAIMSQYNRNKNKLRIKQRITINFFTSSK